VVNNNNNNNCFEWKRNHIFIEYFFTDLFEIKKFPSVDNKIQWRYGWKCPHFMYIVALVLHSCHTRVTLVSHSRHTRVTLVSHSCHTRVTLVPHSCHTRATTAAEWFWCLHFKYPFLHGSCKMASQLWRKIPCLRGSSCKVCNWNIDCDNYYSEPRPIYLQLQ